MTYFLSVLILAAGIVPTADAAQRRLLSVPVTVAPEHVSEAEDGRSDGNWVVQNIVNGEWGHAPFWPNQQWMACRIGNPDYDIWCRLDFKQPRRIYRVRLNNSQLPSFLRLRDLRFEFSGGSTRNVTMAPNDKIQSFQFPPVETTFLKIHLINHYGGHGDRGGLGEVAVYEIVEADEPVTAHPFTLAADGHITTWLILEGATEAAPEMGGIQPVNEDIMEALEDLAREPILTSGDQPIGGEVIGETGGMRAWELTVGEEKSISAPPGSFVFAALESSRPQSVRLELTGARFHWPQCIRATNDVVTTHLKPGEIWPFFLATTAPRFAARLTDGEGKQVSNVRVRLQHQHGTEWLQQTFKRLLAPVALRSLSKTGENANLTLLRQDVGFPLREDGKRWSMAATIYDRTDAEVWKDRLPLSHVLEW